MHNDILQNFEKLLHNVNPVSIHHNNIQTLATEIYKAANGMFPEIISKVFKNKQFPL